MVEGGKGVFTRYSIVICISSAVADITMRWHGCRIAGQRSHWLTLQVLGTHTQVLSFPDWRTLRLKDSPRGSVAFGGTVWREHSVEKRPA